MNSRFRTYSNTFKNDLPASIVLFLVGLPLCIGVALASQAPIFSGLIAGAVGGIVVGMASRSPLSVSGPAAGLSVLVATALATLPSFEAFLLTVIIAGIVQLILGFARTGVVADYVPNSVIKGMITAIGLILIVNQVPHLLGDDSHFENDEGLSVRGESTHLFINFFNAFGHINKSAVMIGSVCLLICLGWDRFIKGRNGMLQYAPAALLAVAAGVGVNFLFKQYNYGEPLTGEHLVSIPVATSAKAFLSFFSTPDWQQLINIKVWTAGIIIGVVASIEGLLSVEAVDELDPYQRVTPTNRELKAQGLGNIISGLLGGLPITSVIVRSSANVQAGAKTKMSAVYHGFLLLFCAAFLPQVVNLIPKAALAAILVFLGYKLARPAIVKAFYRKGWDQFLPFIATVAAILATDLLMGVLAGLGVGLFYVLQNNFGTSLFVVKDGNNYLFRFRKDVSFLNKPLLKRELEKVPANSSVIIDLSRADYVDKDVSETIDDFMLHAAFKSIEVSVKGRSPSTEPGIEKETIISKPLKKRNRRKERQIAEKI